MNSLLDEDTEDDLDDRPAHRDREITLGTTMVLGIFFALAAYGAVLFGFGYSVGVKHLTSTAAVADSNAGASFNGFKPAPGSPFGASSAPAIKPQAVTVPDAPLPVAVTPPKATSQTRPQTPVVEEAAATPAAEPPPPVRAVATPASTPAAAPAAPAVPPGAAGAFLVQVAAVSHQEDADLLVVTLKRRGYPVMIHHEPQDALLHVQIGNFVAKKDAEAMRQRLLADGFNAIVK